MYLIETFLHSSKIHGIGVFCLRDIPKGTTVWRKNPMVDFDLPADSPVITALPDFVRQHLDRHSTTSKDGKTWEVSVDNDAFTNHDSEPNLTYREESNTFVALEKIIAGCELTKDYTKFSYGTDDKELK